MTNTNRLAGVAAAALVVSFLVASIDDADARTRRTRGAVTTGRGVATGEATTTRERGSRVRDATVTGPNGGQVSNHDARTWNRQEGTYSRDHTTTFNDGSQRGVEVDAVRTGEGQFSATREVTGRNGEVRTQTGDFTVTQTEGGRAVTGDISTTNAGQIDYQRNVTRGEGTRGVEASATFEDGTSIQRSSSAACANAACASQTVITGRDGGQTVIDQSRTSTDAGVVLERDTTFADGTTRSIDRERVGNGNGTGTVTREVTGRNGEVRTQTGEYEIDITRGTP